MLQLDHAPWFGGPWGTLPLDDYVAWIEGRGRGGQGDQGPPADTTTTTATTTIPLPPPRTGPPRGAVLLQAADALAPLLPPSTRRLVAIDRAPHPPHSDGPLVDALVAHGAAPYTEFRLAGASLIGGRAEGGNGALRLTRLPTSRADVFADRTLPLPSKRALMRFLTGAADAVLSGGGPLAPALLSRHSPFASLVAREGLPPAAAAAVVYGVGGADADQAAWAEAAEEEGTPPSAEAAPPPLDPPAEAELCGTPLPWAAAPLPSRTAALLLRRHLLSAGRYGATPLLAPVHGGGELAQAFIRAAAVAGGGAAALRRRVVGVQLGDDGRATGVVLASGQVVACGALVLPARAAQALAAGGADHSPAPPPVSRAVAILTSPPAGADAGAPLVLPPRCVDGTTPHAAVRGFVAGAATAATPPGADVCVLHLSCPASDRGARADLEPVLAALATLPGRDATAAPPGRPRTLLAAFHTGEPPGTPAYIQTGLPANVAAVPGPSGGAAACDGAVAAAATVLTRLFGTDVPLLPPRPPDADASDEEAADELEAVLGELGL